MFRTIKFILKNNRCFYTCYVIIELFCQYWFKKTKIEIPEGKRAFVMLAADYENIGDMAITEAQISFLRKQLGASYKIVSVPVQDTAPLIRKLKRIINRDDIITIIGGGNTGGLYPKIDIRRVLVLRVFKNNTVISFPQSVCYTNNSYYRRALEKSVKPLNHFFVARESLSEKEYKKMGISPLLTPDIVFSLKIRSSKHREGISFVMRSDKEKNNHSLSSLEISKLLDIRGMSYSFNDTCDVRMDREPKNIFENYISIISKKRLVITDRLHGMIMCYITKTPCIVFDNNNHKIKYSYENWLCNGQNFIRFIEKPTIKMIEQTIDELMNRKFCPKYVKIDYAFKPLVDLLVEKRNEK